MMTLECRDGEFALIVPVLFLPRIVFLECACPLLLGMKLQPQRENFPGGDRHRVLHACGWHKRVF